VSCPKVAKSMGPCADAGVGNLSVYSAADQDDHNRLWSVTAVQAWTRVMHLPRCRSESALHKARPRCQRRHGDPFRTSRS
jgi:hypothetical protein